MPCPFIMRGGQVSIIFLGLSLLAIVPAIIDQPSFSLVKLVFQFFLISVFWKPFLLAIVPAISDQPSYSLAKLFEPLCQLPAYPPLPRFTSINLITKLLAHSRKCFAAYRTQFCSKTLTFKMMGLQKA